MLLLPYVRFYCVHGLSLLSENRASSVVVESVSLFRDSEKLAEEFSEVVVGVVETMPTNHIEMH